MINPDIISEYGEGIEGVLTGMHDVLTSEERDSLYARGHCFTDCGLDIPEYFASSREDLVDSIFNKVLEYGYGIDNSVILICVTRHGDSGIKVWD